MAERFAGGIVRWRFALVAAWVAAAFALVTFLPSLEEAQSGSLGGLVPLGADAVDAERRSAELFAFPLSSRTVVVERADRLTADRLARITRQAVRANAGELPEVDDLLGVYGITNAVPGLPFARERGTTATSALLFPLELGTGARNRRAADYVEQLGRPRSGTLGVTGVMPARAQQAEAIRDRLPLVELVTVTLIALTVGIYLRSIVAPVVALLTAAVAFLASIRLIALAGEVAGVAVPSEIEPVLVALLFGVVTDYGLFFMSRFRALVAEGANGPDAARRTARELSPIVLTCGLAVAAGCGALAVAELGFLRAFGPGMAIAILVSLVVVLTLLPALLAILGRGLFWPSHPDAGLNARARRSLTVRLIAAAVHRPVTTLVLAGLLVAAMAAPVVAMKLGNPIIRGLPAGSEARTTYAELTRGFAPGVLAPVTLIVEGPGIAARRGQLADLQGVLGDQPGVAGVLGPATSPADRAFGAVLSRTGDAARYVLVPETDPLGADAIRRLENLRVRMPDLLKAVGLPQAEASFAGDTALVAETIALANDDIGRVVPAVLLAIALVLAVFLRSLKAPLYLVVLAALGPLAALGLTVAVFQGLVGDSELTFFVPLVGAVLLVSLGSDYNVFIAGSIWSEMRRRPLREAVIAGGGGAAHAIAAAGLILAASFAALALVPVRAFQELAFMAAAGLLVDAFLVRLVLAPAVIVLAERRRGRVTARRARGGSRTASARRDP
jgi:RND superfamily putative drug exporter